MDKTQKNIALQFLALVLLAFLTGCQKDVKKKDPSFDELKEGVLSSESENNSDATTAYLEKMVSRYPDHPDIPDYKIRLADQYLKEGKFDSAHEFYQHFGRLYPAHTKAEYAKYQAIISKYYQTLKISRECDSSDTQETLRLCQEYLADGSCKAHREKVEEIYATCEERLIDKEIHVYDSYLRRGKYQSAENRLAYLKETFLTKDGSLKPRILYLECKLAQKQNNSDLAARNLEQLISDYPESQFTRMAEGLISRGSLFA